MKKRISLLLSLVLMASTVTGFGAEGKTGEAKVGNSDNALATQVILGNENVPNPAKLKENAKDTLTVYLPNVSLNILPIYTRTTDDAELSSLIFDALYSSDDQGFYNIPRLAENATILNNNKSIVFKLRKDIKWSDGEPFTAKDVENTFLLMADKSYDGRYVMVIENLLGYEAYRDGKTDQLDGLYVKNDYTIIFNFKEASTNNLANVASFPIMPAHVYPYERNSAYKIRKLQNQNIFVGTGRYVFENCDEEGKLSLKANLNWVGGNVSVQKLNIITKSNYDLLRGLSGGEIDIAPRQYVDKMPLAKANQVKFLTRHQYASNSYNYIGLNLRDKRLSELSVRQALVYGFNRQAFVDKFYEGLGMVCNQPISMASWAYSKDVNAYEYNPKKANQLLEQAGWKKGKDGIRVKNGKKLSFIWDTYVDSEYAKMITDMAKQDWRKIGVEVKPNFMEFNALVYKVYCDRKFDMFNMGWGLSANPSSRDIFHSSFDVPEGNNAVGFRNAEADKLMEAIENESDQTVSKELFRKYVKIINEQVPYIFVVQNASFDLTNVRVKNYKVSPFCDWTYHIEDVEIQQ